MPAGWWEGQPDARRMLSLGLCNGKKRIHAMGRAASGAGGGEAPGPLVGAHRRRVSVRQLVWRFRSQWRHAAGGARGGRRARFGYDPESYSQNFDDGVVVVAAPLDGRPSSPPRLPVA